MSLITLDFETYYSKDFSLSKYTTEKYIRDPQFQVIGFSWSVDGGEPHWHSGDNSSTKRVLAQLRLEEHTVLCHNTAFDAAILAWRYGIFPKMLLDTLSMAKPVTGATVGGSLAALAKKFMLGEKGTEVVQAMGKRREDFTPGELAAYGGYCKNDVRLTYALCNVLRQFTTPQELYIIDLLLRMYTDPVIELDYNELRQHLEEVRGKKERLMEKIDRTIGRDALMSNPKFANVLVKLGVNPPTKVSAATGKETWAFGKSDVAFKALLEHEDPRVQAIMSARFGVKSTLEETRTVSFMGISERGPLPIMLVYSAAHTHRVGGGDKVNLQNLPRGGKLRHAMKVPPGHSLVASDSAQIEARVVAWLAGQDDLTEAFANGEDIYSMFASEVYKRPVNRKRKEIGPDGKEFAPDFAAGFVGKTSILGLGFGMGPDKFKATLKIGNGGFSVDLPLEECQKIVALYRAKYVKITDLWKQADSAIKAMASGNTFYLGTGVLLTCDGEGVHLPNGMLLRYNNLSWRQKDDHNGGKIKKDGWYYDTRYGAVSLYGGKLIENIVQALARIVVFNQMCKIDQKLRKFDDRAKGVRYKVTFTVHDEIISCCPTPAAKKVQAMMEACMKVVPKWAEGLPITCESEIGQSYGECK